MTVDDDIATAVELAAQTACRFPPEQRALRRVAKRIDGRRKRQTVTNPRRVDPYLEELVIETWERP